MNQLGKDFMTAIENEFEAVFSSAVTPIARLNVADALFAWLSFTARKKLSADLPQRLEEMRKRFVVLSENFELHYAPGGKLVVRASGEAENTLRMVERGTDWFDPAADATSLIAGAVLD